MKYLALLLLLSCTACHSVSIPTKYGVATVSSLGQKVTIGELAFKEGALQMTGYNNDQVAGMVALFEAGYAAGRKAEAPVP